MEKAVADLIQGAVAADADEQVESLLKQFPGDIRGLAGLFGEDVLEFPEMRADGRLDRFPSFFGLAAGGKRIDDDVDFIHGRSGDG